MNVEAVEMVASNGWLYLLIRAGNDWRQVLRRRGYVIDAGNADEGYVNFAHRLNLASKPEAYPKIGTNGGLCSQKVVVDGRLKQCTMPDRHIELCTFRTESDVETGA